MQRILMSAGRAYDRRLLGVLVALSVPAAFAVLPFAMHMTAAYKEVAGESGPQPAALVFDAIVNVMLVALLGGAGLALANRVGLGMPFIESRIQGTPPPRPFRGVLAMGLLVGAVVGVLILVMDLGIFRQPMLDMFVSLNMEPPKDALAPPHYGLMAAFSAGINEEILFRLFGVSLLVWLSARLIRAADRRPGAGIFWTANILFALVFGAAHLAGASSIGWPMNVLVLTRTFVLNGAAGVAFGWMFWMYGLECSMLAHFFTDVIIYTIMPIVLRPDGHPVVGAGSAAAAAVTLLGIAWAAWTVVRETSREKPIETETVS